MMLTEPGIGVIPMADILLLFGGLLRWSFLVRVRNRVIVTGASGEEYVVLTRQVRG